MGLKEPSLLALARHTTCRNRTKVGLKDLAGGYLRCLLPHRRNRTKVGLKAELKALAKQRNLCVVPQSNQGGIERVQEVLQRGQEVIAAIEPRWD